MQRNLLVITELMWTERSCFIEIRKLLKAHLRDTFVKPKNGCAPLLDIFAIFGKFCTFFDYFPIIWGVGKTYKIFRNLIQPSTLKYSSVLSAFLFTGRNWYDIFCLELGNSVVKVPIAPPKRTDCQSESGSDAVWCCAQAVGIGGRRGSERGGGYLNQVPLCNVPDTLDAVKKTYLTFLAFNLCIPPHSFYTPFLLRRRLRVFFMYLFLTSCDVIHFQQFLFVVFLLLFLF